MSKHTFPPQSTIIGELFSSTTERVMQLAEAPLLVVPKY